MNKAYSFASVVCLFAACFSGYFHHDHNETIFMLMAIYFTLQIRKNK